MASGLRSKVSDATSSGPPPTRRTRGGKHAGSASPEPTLPPSRTTRRSARSNKGPGGVMSDPIQPQSWRTAARRGAPAPRADEEQSVFSVKTRLDEQDEEDAAYPTIIMEEEPRASSPQLPEAQVLDTSVMDALWSKLYDEAKGLVHFLNEPDSEGVWNVLKKSFDLTKDVYMTADTQFLHFQTIEEHFGEGRLDDRSLMIISAANLAILLDAIHRCEKESEELLQLLEQLDENFPWSIVSPTCLRPSWRDEYGNDPLIMANDIRTQRWILGYDGRSLDEGMELGVRLFCEGRGWNRLQEGPFKRLGGIDLNATEDEEISRVKEIVVNRIRNILQFISQDDQDQQALAGLFPMDHFIARFKKWVADAFEEVGQHNDREEEKDQEDDPNAQLTQETDDAVARAGSELPGSDPRNKQLPINETTIAELVRLAIEPSDRVSKRRAIVGDPDYDEVQGSPSDDLESLLEADAPLALPARKSPHKRKSRHRPDIGHSSPSNSQQPRSSASQRVPAHHPLPTQSQLPVQRQSPQSRRSWNPRDSEILCKYIDELGCNWALIEKRAKKQLSVERNQQQLRDRARNIKVDILKHDKKLPSGFDNVVIHGKMIDVVIKAGKNPDRTETDIDANGNPTNTEFVD